MGYKGKTIPTGIPVGMSKEKPRCERHGESYVMFCYLFSGNGFNLHPSTIQHHLFNRTFVPKLNEGRQQECHLNVIVLFNYLQERAHSVFDGLPRLN